MLTRPAGAFCVSLVPNPGLVSRAALATATTWSRHFHAPHVMDTMLEALMRRQGLPCQPILFRLALSGKAGTPHDNERIVPCGHCERSGQDVLPDQ